MQDLPPEERTWISNVATLKRQVNVTHLSLRQIHSLAQTHPHWLRPRWPARVQVWRELLLAAASGEAPVLERARLHGLTLLAADARASLPERSDAGALGP